MPLPLQRAGRLDLQRFWGMFIPRKSALGGLAMSSFMKGMTFTMGGKEYEVLAEGTNDPSSCLVYVPRYEKETADPLTIRMWKAEAKLARGDIMISGYADDGERNGVRSTFYPPVTDPLEQIAELKKRIQAIERRRLTLLKVDDPTGVVLLQDNVVRPNKAFDIWDFTRASGDIAKKERHIQYVKIRGLMLVISGNSALTERFLFNIADQLQPCCRIAGDTLSSEGKIKIDLTSRLKTIQGGLTQLLTDDMGGKIELAVELRLNCKYATGMTSINARILQAAYIREVNGPGFKINNLTFPEIGSHLIAIEGICVDIYTDGPEEREVQY